MFIGDSRFSEFMDSGYIDKIKAGRYVLQDFYIGPSLDSRSKL
jgi:hypothetical protein